MLETYFESRSRRGGRSFTVELVTPSRPPEDLVYVDDAMIGRASDATWFLYVETTGVPEVHDWIASRMRGEILDVGDGRVDLAGPWHPPISGVVVPPPPWPEPPERKGCLRAFG
jgi:hypothetical protein